MIKTEHLVEFMRSGKFWVSYDHIEEEYREEIVARLESHDKLKESIEKLCRRLSSGVDESIKQGKIGITGEMQKHTTLFNGKKLYGPELKRGKKNE